jgi:hypothetical protein
LDDIVSIRVPDEDLCMLGNLGGKFDLLLLVGPIDALLHDAASVFVTSNLHTLIDHCIVDELVVLGGPATQYFLNHVVPVNIFSKFPHFGLQVITQLLDVLGLFHCFYYLLD